MDKIAYTCENCGKSFRLSMSQETVCPFCGCEEIWEEEVTLSDGDVFELVDEGVIPCV